MCIQQPFLFTPGHYSTVNDLKLLRTSDYFQCSHLLSEIARIGVRWWESYTIVCVVLLEAGNFFFYFGLLLLS